MHAAEKNATGECATKRDDASSDTHGDGITADRAGGEAFHFDAFVKTQFDQAGVEIFGQPREAGNMADLKGGKLVERIGHAESPEKAGKMRIPISITAALQKSLQPSTG